MNQFQELLFNYLEKEESINLPSHVRKVASSVALCRTNAMRGRVYSCPNNHFSVFMRESCNNRLCPNCQDQNKLDWKSNTLEKVTNSPHYHLVFKLPTFVYPFILKYYKEFIDILFDSASNTISKIIKYSFDLNPSVAFFSVLHTHGNSLQLHPHLHVVLNSICLSKDKDKLFFLQDSLFNFDNFKSIFTQILKKELLSLLNKYPSLGDQFLFDTKNFKNESLFYYKKYDSPIQIIDYLSKTIKGSAINLDKVDFLDDGSVFLEKNNKYFKLSKVELIIRFIKQIIPSKIKSVRYSGFYSSASKDNLQIVNDLLNNTFEVIQPESDHTPEDESNIFSPIHKICPICKSKMILEENVDEYAVPNIVYIKFGKDPPTEQLFTRLVA